MLSDKYYKIINCSLKNNLPTFGKGMNYEKINNKIHFEDPVIKECLSSDKLFDYYSFSGLLIKIFPIVNLFNFLFKYFVLWKNFLFQNCLKNREYLDILLRKNIGPNSLFLISLEKENIIKSTDTIMSKFSHHIIIL